jgi:hypothetical protein
MITTISPSQLVLDIVALKPDGDAKTNVTSATVRVFKIVSGSEVDVLSLQALTQVGSTNVYRYVWTPGTLDAGNYLIEYKLEDSDSLLTTVHEELVAGYLEADIDAIASDVEVIKKIETGRWKIIANQLILYGPDNTTEIARFNLFDSSGNPTSDAVADRVKV